MNEEYENKNVIAHRVRVLEGEVQQLRQENVSPQWLDERFGRLGDQITTLARTVEDMQSTDRSRRLAVYTAVVTGVVSLVAALVVVAMTIPSGPT